MIPPVLLQADAALSSRLAIAVVAAGTTAVVAGMTAVAADTTVAVAAVATLIGRQEVTPAK